MLLSLTKAGMLFKGEWREASKNEGQVVPSSFLTLRNTSKLQAIGKYSLLCTHK